MIGISAPVTARVQPQTPQVSCTVVPSPGAKVQEIGMFSFTGLSKEQVENMTNKWHIYMTFDGRISLAGLSSSKTRYLAEAMVDSFKNA